MQISSHNVLLAAQQSAAAPKASSASFAAALKELPASEPTREAQTSAPARPMRPGAMLDIKV